MNFPINTGKVSARGLPIYMVGGAEYEADEKAGTMTKLAKSVDINAVCNLSYTAQEKTTKTGKIIPSKVVFTQKSAQLKKLSETAVIGRHVVTMNDGTEREYIAFWKAGWSDRWTRDKIPLNAETKAFFKSL